MEFVIELCSWSLFRPHQNLSSLKKQKSFIPIPFLFIVFLRKLNTQTHVLYDLKVSRSLLLEGQEYRGTDFIQGKWIKPILKVHDI